MFRRLRKKNQSALPCKNDQEPLPRDPAPRIQFTGPRSSYSFPGSIFRFSFPGSISRFPLPVPRHHLGHLHPAPGSDRTLP